MLILYFIVGSILAAMGGAFPGASNIAVVSATVNGQSQSGKQIAYGAGLGEITLAFLALYYSMMVTDFFAMNPWIKVAFVLVFLIVGGLFLIKHRLPKKQSQKDTSSNIGKRLLKGYALAALNPPVLLFWLIAIALIHNNYFELSATLSTAELLLFFVGVFAGKISILLLYASTGKRLMQKKQQSGNRAMNTFIGIALIGISLVQGIRLLFI